MSGWVGVWPLAKPAPPQHGTDHFSPQADHSLVRGDSSRRETVRGGCKAFGKLPSTRCKVYSQYGSRWSPWARSLLFCCCEASWNSCFSRKAGVSHQTVLSPSAFSALRRMQSWQPMIYSQHLALGRELTPPVHPHHRHPCYMQ